jgi:hypothetical protein
LTRQQQKYYDLLKKAMVMQASGEEITSVNAAVNMSKLLQISCIAYNTDVLTDKGWIPIQDVTDSHLVWDGDFWVAQGGSVYKGIKRVIKLDGVRLTPDHLVWSDGWYSAQELKDGYASDRFNRTEVRLPDRFKTWGAGSEQNENRTVGMSVRLREYSGTAKSVSEANYKGTTAQLWLSSRQRNPQNVKFTPVPHMVGNAQALLRYARQGLQKLWGTGYYYMQCLEQFFRVFLGGYAIRVREGLNLRPHRCERPIQPGKLPLGHVEAAGEQHAEQHSYRYPKGANDSYTGSGSVWDKEGYASRPSAPIRVDSGTGIEYAGEDRVYDLLNCGPRNRFVVRGDTGIPIIVHNCGAVYSDTGETLEFDISKRYSVLTEAIDESSQKVLVFVPFKHVISILTERLNKDGYPTEVINGDVPVSKRTDIFNRFQNDPKGTRVLVIQPQSAAHGVTLTAANTVVWWGPVASLEIYAQANARVHRSGQRHPSTVIQLAGSGMERHVYNLLDNKIDVYSKIVDLFNDLLE